jgi:hypothetical protein
MSSIVSSSTHAPRHQPELVGRLFFLDLAGSGVLSANPDGSDLKTPIEEGRKLPDGLAIDVAAGHLYWTNMGNPKRNDGSILRSDLDGANLTTLVPQGGTFTLPPFGGMPRRASAFHTSFEPFGFCKQLRYHMDCP